MGSRRVRDPGTPFWQDCRIRAARSSLFSSAGSRSCSVTRALWLIAVGAVCATAVESAVIVHQGIPYAWLEALYPVVSGRGTRSPT